MNNNVKRHLLSAVSVAIFGAFSAQAAELQPVQAMNNQAPGAGKSTSFARWLDEKKRNERADVTERLIVDFDDELMANAIAEIQGKGKGKGVGKEMRGKARQMLRHFESVLGEAPGLIKAKSKGKAVFAVGRAQSVAKMNRIASRLAKGKGVKKAEADPRRFLMAQNQPWGISEVQADQLSDSNSDNMTVCIIDSGYDINHPDLSGNQHSGTNDSGTGNWYQPGGSHGTHVAGTIAAINNSEGVEGVLPNQYVNLHIVKVFTESGWAYSSDLVDAVTTCANSGANVVNMSLGGASSSTTEQNGMQNILDSGVLLVAAAGNSGDGTHSYPASYDAVMSVAAVDESGLHAEFSQYTNQVEVAGPGEAILSTVAIGDGRQGYVNWGSNSAGDDRVLPHTRYAQSNGSYVQSNINGMASGELAACTTSGTSFSCGNMTGKVCVVERAENQSGSNYPEIDAARACADAGAEAAIVYSNSERPGLQNPFLVDDSDTVNIPTVSVNRTFGQQLVSASGVNASVDVKSGTDYAYYNGTSMASPHVAGVAALAWSQNPSCTASDVRSALTATALDLDVAGRDDRTGYGLVQAKEAADYLAANCDTGGGDPGANVLENGQTVSDLSAAQGDSVSYTMEVPAGASDLSFVMTGGSGDADLYVKFGSEPSSGDYDCRPYKNGNEEQCDFSTPQQGTYYVKIVGYTSFSGVSLTGSYTEGTTGGGNEGGSASESDLSASSGEWLHFTVDIPAGMSNLTVDITGGSGDADLYVREGAQPTTSNYDCRPYENGNEEICSFDNPVASTWHIGIRAYSSFSGLTLNAQWQP